MAMIMVITTTMTETALLTLCQILSPAFPTGAFAYSHGLEQAIAAGEIHDRDSLQGWLADVLEFGAGWTDAVLMGRALAGDPSDALDEVAQALCLTSERLTETMEQGSAFARTSAVVLGSDPAPVALPVAVGRAARGLGLPPATTIAHYLQGFAGNLVSCTVRFMPLAPTEGQRVLAMLAPLIAEIAARAADAGLDDLSGGAVRAEMASALHETMDVRIFRT